jgi:hypothetical protein
MVQETQILNYSSGIYPLALLVLVFIALATAGVWLVYKFFRKGKDSVKENENFADKNFVSYLNVENLQIDKLIETAHESKSEDGEGCEDVDLNPSENEISKLAKKYNIGQGEVELLLNLRSKKTKKENGYLQVLDAIEKGEDIKKLAKKYKVGCGEIQLMLNLKNANQNAFLKKWR